jgi:LAO/AO transport system kinase
LCSALKDEGVDEVWKMIKNYLSITSENDFFKQKRQEQNKYWLLQTIDEHLKHEFYNDSKIKEELVKQLKLIEASKTTPFAAAEYLLNL